MPQNSSPPVSELLARWKAGDQDPLRQPLPLAYNELRRVAHCQLRQERPDHTLECTALVHEAYLRLLKQDHQRFQNLELFFAVSAHLMRQILVDYARRRNDAKRDGGYKLTLDENADVAKARDVDRLALDDALEGLSKFDLQQSRIVELQFFAGLFIQETARVLGISPATGQRKWSTARIWLHHQLSRAES